MEVEVIELAATSSDVTSKNTVMAVWVWKFDVAYYRYKIHLLRDKKINDAEVPLRDISGAQVFFFAQSFCVYKFEHAYETMPVTATTTKNRCEACEGALWSTFQFTRMLRP